MGSVFPENSDSNRLGSRMVWRRLYDLLSGSLDDVERSEDGDIRATTVIARSSEDSYVHAKTGSVSLAICRMSFRSAALSGTTAPA